MKLPFNSVIRYGTTLAAVLITFSALNAADAPDASKTRAQKPSPAILAKYDTNNDLVLDDAEIAAMNADIAKKAALAEAKRVKKYDANKDGKLDETEIAAEMLDRGQKKSEVADKHSDKKTDLIKIPDQVADNAPSSK